MDQPSRNVEYTKSVRKASNFEAILAKFKNSGQIIVVPPVVSSPKISPQPKPVLSLPSSSSSASSNLSTPTPSPSPSPSPSTSTSTSSTFVTPPVAPAWASNPSELREKKVRKQKLTQSRRQTNPNLYETNDKTQFRAGLHKTTSFRTPAEFSKINYTPIYKPKALEEKSVESSENEEIDKDYDKTGNWYPHENIKKIQRADDSVSLVGMRRIEENDVENDNHSEPTESIQRAFETFVERKNQFISKTLGHNKKKNTPVRKNSDPSGRSQFNHSQNGSLPVKYLRFDIEIPGDMRNVDFVLPHSSEYYYQINSITTDGFIQLLKPILQNGTLEKKFYQNENNAESNQVFSKVSPAHIEEPSESDSDWEDSLSYHYSDSVTQKATSDVEQSVSSSSCFAINVDQLVKTKISLRTKLPSTFETFQRSFRSSSISSNEFNHRIFEIIQIMRAFYQELQFFYCEQFFSPAAEINVEVVKDEHLKTKKQEHRKLFEEIIVIYANLLENILAIEYNEHYSTNLLRTFYEFYKQNPDFLIKYLRNYRNSGFGIKSEEISALFFKNLNNIHLICNSLKSNHGSHQAEQIAVMVQHIIEESDSHLQENDNIRHLMCLDMAFINADPRMKLTINSAVKNSVVAEMRVYLTKISDAPKPTVGNAFSNYYIETPANNKELCNIFLLEDRVVFSRCTTRSDKQSLYFYFYLRSTNVLPVCLDKHNIEMDLKYLNPQGVKEMRSKNLLRFEFKPANGEETRIYRAKIVEIEQTSLVELRSVSFVKKTLINDAIKFLELYNKVCESYSWEHPEEDEGSGFIRITSIRSEGAGGE